MGCGYTVGVRVSPDTEMVDKKWTYGYGIRC